MQTAEAAAYDSYFASFVEDGQEPMSWEQWRAMRARQAERDAAAVADSAWFRR